MKITRKQGREDGARGKRIVGRLSRLLWICRQQDLGTGASPVKEMPFTGREPRSSGGRKRERERYHFRGKENKHKTDNPQLFPDEGYVFQNHHPPSLSEHLLVSARSFCQSLHRQNYRSKREGGIESQLSKYHLQGRRRRQAADTLRYADSASHKLGEIETRSVNHDTSPTHMRQRLWSKRPWFGSLELNVSGLLERMPLETMAPSCPVYVPPGGSQRELAIGVFTPRRMGRPSLLAGC